MQLIATFPQAHGLEGVKNQRSLSYTTPKSFKNLEKTTQIAEKLGAPSKVSTSHESESAGSKLFFVCLQASGMYKYTVYAEAEGRQQGI